MAILSELKARALELRIDVLRATSAAQSGHPTSCFSAAELVSALFFDCMRFDACDPTNPENDRFVLSKGHAAPLLYAIYKQLGIISDEELLTLRQFNSRLEGHPTRRFEWAEAATGSLGQGLSIGLGIALAQRADHTKARTFVLLGDSELAEGSNWEAAAVAAHYNANNLYAIVDANKLGQRGETMEHGDVEQYVRKFEAFGWRAFTVNGHNLEAVVKAVQQLTTSDNRPSILIAKTVKGYGLGEAVEGKNGYHGKAFSKEQLPTLIARLQEQMGKTSAAKPIHQACEKRDCEPATLQTEPADPLPKPSYKIGEMVAARKAYGHALVALGKVNEAIVVFDAEVKNSTFSELFEQAFPDRFYECFIAEQNMIGMASGFATRGKTPFCSTFASFFSRAHDQLRMTAIGQLPVRCAGSHAGVSIGQDGPSQMGMEDIGIFRALPESIVLYPCDAVSTHACVGLMAQYSAGMSYLRLTRSDTPVIYEADTSFKIGGCHILRSSNNDVCCVVAAGITVFEALAAHETLKKQGIAIRVIDCYSIKPLPIDQLVDAVSACKGRVITVEDHYREGGFGEAIVSELAPKLTLQPAILAATKLPRSGASKELLAFEQIDAAAVVQAVMTISSR